MALRVLMISPRFTETAGGDGLYAFNLANACVGKGVEVHALTIRDGSFVHIDWNKSNSRQGTESAHTFTRLGNVDEGFFRKNFYSRSARKSIEWTIRKTKPDIIHIHGIHQYFTLASVRSLKRFAGPVVSTVHDYKLLCGNSSFFSDRSSCPCTRCLRGRFLPPLSERCKKGSFVASAGTSLQMALWQSVRGLDVFDVIHCGSKFAYTLLSENPSIRNKLALVRMPVLRHSSTARRHKAGKKPELAYIGRMVSHKGPSIFADAVQGTTVPIKIYGDGPLMSDVVSRLQGTPSVSFRGWVTHEVMDEELGPGTIVVVPYLAHETFCYVVLEAMVRGCCVVASARGAIPELIDDGLNGVLVQTPTAGEFRKAIDGLLHDQDLILKIGERAKNIVNQIPSLTDHANNILSLYTKAIGERNP